MAQENSLSVYKKFEVPFCKCLFTLHQRTETWWAGLSLPAMEHKSILNHHVVKSNLIRGAYTEYLLDRHKILSYLASWPIYLMSNLMSYL